MGRLPVITTLNSLDKEALVRILTEPKNSIIKQYTELFALDGVELTFEKDSLEAIADKTIEKETGARGLRSIVEDVLMNLMYDTPSDDTVERVIITADCLTQGGEPIIIHKKKKAE